MDERRKASLLWGVVGALTFLVLAQGYRLMTDQGVGILPMFAVAVIVFAGAAGATYVAGAGADSKRRV